MFQVIWTVQKMYFDIQNNASKKKKKYSIKKLFWLFP